MLAFYIDEKLTAEEESQLLGVLRARGLAQDKVEYRRIPGVFPDKRSRHTNDQLIEIFKRHVRNAGMPVGEQSIFIVPKEGIRWTVLIHEAIFAVTGYYPWMIQQWQGFLADDDSEPMRRDYLNMIDMHAAFHGK